MLSLEIIDLTTGTSLGQSGLGPVYGEGQYEPLGLTGSPPSARVMETIFTYSYQPTPGVQPVNGSVHFTTNETPVGQPTVTQPVLVVSPSTSTSLKIGLGRSSPPTDCDYWYNEPNINNPNIRLPLVGNQEFASNIVTPLFNGSQPVNLQYTIILTKQTGGTTQTLPITTQNLQNYVYVSPTDPKNLMWNFPWNSNVASDLSAQFGQAAWANDSNRSHHDARREDGDERQ